MSVLLHLATWPRYCVELRHYFSYANVITNHISLFFLLYKEKGTRDYLYILLNIIKGRNGKFTDIPQNTLSLQFLNLSHKSFIFQLLHNMSRRTQYIIYVISKHYILRRYFINTCMVKMHDQDIYRPFKYSKLFFSSSKSAQDNSFYRDFLCQKFTWDW